MSSGASGLTSLSVTRRQQSLLHREHVLSSKFLHSTLGMLWNGNLMSSLQPSTTRELVDHVGDVCNTRPTGTHDSIVQVKPTAPRGHRVQSH